MADSSKTTEATEELWKRIDHLSIEKKGLEFDLWKMREQRDAYKSCVESIGQQIAELRRKLGGDDLGF